MPILLTSLADMYIFYITYVIVCYCWRVAPLIATCVYVLKGVSLTILYLYIGEIKNLSVYAIHNNHIDYIPHIGRSP